MKLLLVLICFQHTQLRYHHKETQQNKKYVDIDNLLKNITKTQCEEFAKLLPNCMDRPQKVYKMYNRTEPYQLIIFYLESTDKGRAAEICQLSAITQDGHTYSSYVLPKGNVSVGASRVNNLTVEKEH